MAAAEPDADAVEIQSRVLRVTRRTTDLHTRGPVETEPFLNRDRTTPKPPTSLPQNDLPGESWTGYQGTPHRE